MIERALMKSIASLKVCMMRLDDALDHLDDNEWLVRETLMQHRAFIHQQINSLLRLRRKLSDSLFRILSEKI
jgi:hypothetical protein